MTLTDEQIADLEFRVEDGADFLDALMPGWWDKIDLDRLTMTGGGRADCGCVVMQLNPVGPGYHPFLVLGVSYREATELGFSVQLELELVMQDDPWEVLQRKWEEAILDRRAGISVG